MAGGRPSKMTPETVRILEEAFLLGCTDGEACFSADISRETLYEYIRKNPEFSDRKESLKKSPIYEARKSVLKGLKDDPVLALKFLERKKKDEFSLKQEHEVKVSNVELVPPVKPTE